MAGPYHRIALPYVEWAGAAWQSVVVPWRLIDGPAAAEGFAAELAKTPTFSAPSHRDPGGLGVRLGTVRQQQLYGRSALRPVEAPVALQRLGHERRGSRHVADNRL